MSAAYICFGPEFLEQFFAFDPVLSPISLEMCLSMMFTSEVWDLNNGDPIKLDNLPVIQCCPPCPPFSAAPPRP